eukprot:XP_011426943.1 PREDICTED: uncharacterized protein LOC105327955 [Crassostrea gigas]
MESLSEEMCAGMQHMSESVFVGLCEIVGTSTQVAMRRETVDIKEMLERRVTASYAYIEMMSGSNREGFRLKGSDVDVMYWPNNHRVIMDMSQSEYYNKANTTLILSESSESPPGFTLLQLLTQTTYKEVQSACVRMNGRTYISSSKYRQLTCSATLPNSVVNGPCGSGDIGQEVEYDTAFCFVSDVWPPSASSWKDRCHSWPYPEVVDDIVRSGCHFVAIGHPLGLHEQEEWRMSFSQAENRCVCAMDHYQFLTYGLLKLFLKEVVNQQSEETKGLLCSYHMKTTIFWAIQQNTVSNLCPQNFLAGFWVCSKLLLKWVYEGVSPNFFIPQNNLFLTKVHGSTQNRLFLQLHELYKKGLACLLQSSSIRSYIISALYNPRLSINTDESVLKCEIDHDLEFFLEMSCNDNVKSNSLYSCMKHLTELEHLICSPLTEYKVLMLQKLKATILQRTAFILHINKGVNKQIYIPDKLSCQLITLAAKFGCVSDMLYIAMYYYETLRYREALSVIKMTETKLVQPCLIYRRHVDTESYIEAVGGQSWATKMRQAMAGDIKLYSTTSYISELILEQQSALQNRVPALYVPVFVMLLFLEFLCYRHIDTTLSQETLDKLHILIHLDQGLYVRDIFRDISWEILGICQQITGNAKTALYSYQQSMSTRYPIHQIQNATQKRIQELRSSISHQQINCDMYFH